MTNTGTVEGLELGKCGEEVEESSWTQPTEDSRQAQQGGWARNCMVGFYGPSEHLSEVFENP